MELEVAEKGYFVFSSLCYPLSLSDGVIAIREAKDIMLLVKVRGTKGEECGFKIFGSFTPPPPERYCSL